MRKLRPFVSIVLSLVLAIGILGCYTASETQAAAKKPAKPVITLESAKNDTAVMVTISATDGASGYRIYMKAEGDAKYSKVKTLKKNGTLTRSATITKLKEGTYSFKVKAYSKASGKTVWGKYSKAKTITLPADSADAGEQKTAGMTADEVLKTYYPGLKGLADQGLIGIKAEKKDIITLGSWVCDIYDHVNYEHVSSGKKEKLEWEVLEYSEDGKAALVVSKYLICDRRYNDKDKPVTWETCSIRNWLNKEFYEEAFSEAERRLIKTTKVVNEDNASFGTKGGNDTEDRLFLLSVSEADKYFKSGSHKDSALSRTCGYIDGEASWWILRSPGYDSSCVSCVSEIGVLFDGVIDDGGYQVGNKSGIRPAFWIELTPEIIENNKLSVGGYETVSASDIYVTFGSWDHETYNDENWSYDPVGTKENIEWKILEYDAENNRVLLISRYLLCGKKYDDKKRSYDDPDKDVTWEECSIRKWLNNEFYNDAFTETERRLIGKTTVINESNDFNGTDGGSDTEDYLFLLSLSETDRYFKSDTRNDYAINRVCAYIDGNRDWDAWWLRSPGSTGDCAAYVDSSGSVATRGNYVDNENGIRPAFWMKVEP